MGYNASWRQFYEAHAVLCAYSLCTYEGVIKNSSQQRKWWRIISESQAYSHNESFFPFGHNSWKAAKVIATTQNIFDIFLSTTMRFTVVVFSFQFVQYFGFQTRPAKLITITSVHCSQSGCRLLCTSTDRPKESCICRAAHYSAVSLSAC